MQNYGFIDDAATIVSRVLATPEWGVDGPGWEELLLHDPGKRPPPSFQARYGVHFHILGQLRLRQGKLELAKRLLDIAVELSPTFTPSKDARKRVEQQLDPTAQDWSPILGEQQTTFLAGIAFSFVCMAALKLGGDLLLGKGKKQKRKRR